MLGLVSTLLCMPLLESKLDRFLVPINMAVLTLSCKKIQFPSKNLRQNMRYLSLYTMLMQTKTTHATINPLLSLTRTNWYSHMTNFKLEGFGFVFSLLMLFFFLWQRRHFSVEWQILPPKMSSFIERFRSFNKKKLRPAIQLLPEWEISSVFPLSPSPQKKKKSKILTERTKTIHVINIFNGGEQFWLLLSLTPYA